jgi:uncharacterized protein (DUF433 family)
MSPDFRPPRWGNARDEFAAPMRSGYSSSGAKTDGRFVAASWKDCEAVERHPDQVSGAWVFRGTRVPAAALFENLKDGASVPGFLTWFPGVERFRLEAVLEHEAARR